MAGCPRCAVDLVRANPHKESTVHPNGFATFKELRVGEKLALPSKWFNGDLESRPRAYFIALPHYDGVTPGTFGVGTPNVLNDYATLDVASAKVGALAALGDQAFAGERREAPAVVGELATCVSRTRCSASAVHR